ncbi:hypothetical protein D9M70_405110 [compost metagenome]
MRRIRTRRYCVVPHCNGVVVGGPRRIPHGNATSTGGRRAYTSRQCVDTGRAVVVVVAAHRAVVVDAVVVSLCGRELRHVDRIGVIRAGRQTGDAAVTDIHFAGGGTAHQVGLINQGGAIRDGAGTQGDAAIMAGYCAGTQGQGARCGGLRVVADGDGVLAGGGGAIGGGDVADRHGVGAVAHIVQAKAATVDEQLVAESQRVAAGLGARSVEQDAAGLRCLVAGITVGDRIGIVSLCQVLPAGLSLSTGIEDTNATAVSPRYLVAVIDEQPGSTNGLFRHAAAHQRSRQRQDRADRRRGMRHHAQEAVALAAH